MRHGLQAESRRACAENGTEARDLGKRRGKEQGCGQLAARALQQQTPPRRQWQQAADDGRTPLNAVPAKDTADDCCTPPLYTVLETEADDDCRTLLPNAIPAMDTADNCHTELQEDLTMVSAREELMVLEEEGLAADGKLLVPERCAVSAREELMVLKEEGLAADGKLMVPESCAMSTRGTLMVPQKMIVLFLNC